MTIQIEKPNIAHSVTEGDANPTATPSAFYLGWFQPYLDYVNQLLPKLPPYWSRERDYLLASTLTAEDFWAGALSIAISQTASHPYDIEGDVDLQIKRSHELFEDANGGEGFDHFMSQFLLDFLTTDNGGFCEIARATDSPLAKITGIYHLDSIRCWRTANPETPVVYQDFNGEWHYLKWYQVFSIADMPNPRRNYFGIGHCAASRAYQHIRRRKAIELYLYEKISGNSPQEINFITGITDLQLRDILASNEAERQAKGLTVYGGAALVAMMVKDGTIGHVKIPIADLPEKFDAKLDLDQTLLAYANALGMDSQDLQPLTGHAIGTGSQSKTLDNKAKNKGLAFFRSRWTHFTNRYLLPGTTKWVYVDRDLQEEKEKADIELTKVQTQVAAIKDVGIVTPQQALQKLVDEDVYPKEFLPGPDMTPYAALGDDEQSEELDAIQPATQAVQQIVQPIAQAVAPPQP
jgi:hypothetical protein